MDREEMMARLRRAKSIVNNISVAGKNNWQALLLVTADLEAVEEALAAEEARAGVEPVAEPEAEE